MFLVVYVKICCHPPYINTDFEIFRLHFVQQQDLLPDILATEIRKFLLLLFSKDLCTLLGLCLSLLAEKLLFYTF